MGSTGYASTPFTIAERGKAPVCVIVKDGEGPSLDYAAGELRDWTEKLVGVRLRIVRPDEAKGADTIRLRLDPKGSDAFRIVCTDGVEISGGRRGVLYGVYELLESVGGIRWLSSETTVIPKADRFEIPSDFARDERPAFELREGFWRDLRANPDFAARLRFNGARTRSAERHGGAAYVYAPKFGSCHTFFRLVPPQEFYKDHPEYFSEVKGERLEHRTQLCLSNPDVRRIAKERLLRYIRENPQYDFYGVSQMDWDNYCTCPKCRAVDEAEGSPAGSVIRFVNEIADAVEREFPDKMVETLSYRYSRKAPKTAPRDNVLICLCSDNLNRAEPLVGSTNAANVAFRETLAAWGRLTKNIYLWDYVTDFAHYLNAMPNTLALGPNLRFFRDNGVRYMFEQGDVKGFHGDFAELKAYLISKFSWNPDRPVEPLLREFFDGYYGAAAPIVRRYFDEVHALPHPKPMGMSEAPDAPWRSDEFLERADDLWKKAIEAVKDDPQRLKNVRMGRAGTVYAILYRHRRDFIGVWCTRDPGRFRAKAERHRERVEFLDACRKDGAPLRPVENEVRNARTERRLDQLARMVRVPEKGCDRATFRYDVMDLGVEWYRRRGTIERVKDKEAAGGEAVRLIAGERRHALQLRESEMALDREATYRLRVRLRPGAGPSDTKGEAVRIGLYNDRTNAHRVKAFEPSRADLKPGWAWYDLFSFQPREGDRLFANPAKDAATGDVLIDSFEIIRQNPSNK